MKSHCIILSVTILLLVSVSSSLPGQSKRTQSSPVILKNDVSDFISINNILMWMGNNGMMAHNPLTDACGLEWPKGSEKYCVFTDGLVWGGKVQGEIRTGGATWRYGLQAGPIGTDGTAADPSNPAYRIYKIRKVDSVDYHARLGFDEHTRLKTDFLNWPVKDGAPWVDRNHNGVYEPDFDDWLSKGGTAHSDTPWFVGDEVLWFVTNDLDATRTMNLYGSNPVGLEVQTLIWGYDRPGPLANMVFTKYTIINKGSADYQDVYFAKFSDPDLGNPSDDYVGIDTNATLAIAYNGLPYDAVYHVPPALGYDFMQSPIVPANANDVARSRFGLRQGYRNVPVSSFLFYNNSDATYGDPDLGRYAGTEQLYNNMQGLMRNGDPYIDPHTGSPVRICLAGDPVTGEGWIDGELRAPGNRFLLLSVGPCTLARKDTQEVVIATMVARGADRLNSIQVLRYYDRVAQSLFDRNFALPAAPPQPVVLAASQPGKIILAWGRPEEVDTIEHYRDQNYVFEGYNVYQFPSATASLGEGVRLATFDRIDGIATIFDEGMDEKTGTLFSIPVQYGSDSGIQHMLTITDDALTGLPLLPYQSYFFAVTAYTYSAERKDSPRQVESVPVIIEVRPQPWPPGVEPGAALNERLPVNHTKGAATGLVEVEVIDALRLTGDTYAVSFNYLGKVQVVYDGTDTLTFDNYASWDLTNISKNTKPVRGSTVFAGLETDYFVVDGFRIGVTGSGYYEPGTEVLRREWIPVGSTVPGTAPYTDNGGYIPFEAGYLFFGSSIPGYDIVETVEIRFDRTKPSKGCMYLRGGSPNYVYQGYFESPMQIFDVSDKANPRQLQWAFVEQINNTSQDNIWAPTTSPGEREYLFILRDTYSETPNPVYTGYKINTDAVHMPILYAAWVYQRQNYGTKFPWKDGDVWRIVPNVPFAAGDRYTFTTMASPYSHEHARRQIPSINVFPNPYVGVRGDGVSASPMVTFTYLPQRALIRIYTVSGMLVRSLEKNDYSQTLQWDLTNENHRQVAPGMYIVHISLPDLNDERILKLGIGTIYSIIKAD